MGYFVLFCGLFLEKSTYFQKQPITFLNKRTFSKNPVDFKKSPENHGQYTENNKKQHSHTGGCYLAKKKERPGIYPGRSDYSSFNAMISVTDIFVASAICSYDRTPCFNKIFAVSILVSSRSSFRISSIALHIVVTPS